MSGRAAKSGGVLCERPMTGLLCLTVLVVLCCACQSSVGRATVPFTGFRWLADGSYHESSPPTPVWGFYVLGRLEGETFLAVTDVEGQGELGEAGTSGWLELGDGSFHATLPTAPPPVPPYVQGYMGLDGEFAPTGRRVMH